MKLINLKDLQKIEILKNLYRDGNIEIIVTNYSTKL
jgi:hypothetical protein